MISHHQSRPFRALRRLALLLAGLSLPAHAADEADFLRNIKDYLAVSEKYVTLANSRETAIFFAVEGIVEIHEARGERANAVPFLQKILEKYPDNQTVRNIIHFKLRDVYKETGRSDLALGELEAVIEENR